MSTPHDTYKSAVLGSPLNPEKKPSRIGTVKAFAEMQVQLEAGQGGAIVKSTLVDLNALTEVPSSSVMAWVTNDPTKALNGIYENIGSASSPNFEKRIDIPQFIITGLNLGDGTANDLKVDTDLPIPEANGRALIIIPVLEDNTGSVTVSFNGETAIPVISNSGNPIPSGGLITGMHISGWITDNGFRLMNDVVNSSIVAQAEIAATQAAISAATASEEIAAAASTISNFEETSFTGSVFEYWFTYNLVGTGSGNVVQDFSVDIDLGQVHAMQKTGDEVYIRVVDFTGNMIDVDNEILIPGINGNPVAHQGLHYDGTYYWCGGDRTNTNKILRVERSNVNVTDFNFDLSQSRFGTYGTRRVPRSAGAR